ncbi:peptidyl-prolyl cis-trans isomerase FKBP62-like [Cephus cinctus]|uniref:Peptidyl-prolyl cis-trans isomerase FKBP62-like n=1 Tax=Cephus cinctus TaxID=211228 RepID=A0AAJ7RP79_CEPCN|nr:peptidyl-prolyl cis-trans isomerase FKBP62-like [Cephus cinctus]
MTQVWTSADHRIIKEVLRKGTFSNKAIERCVCHIQVEKIEVDGIPVIKLSERFNSEILNGIYDKEITIGDLNSAIDRDIERAIQMMFINEHSLVIITLPYSAEDSSEVKCLKFEVTLTAIKPHKPIWEWTPGEKYLMALKYKEKGVELFKASRFVDAFYRFSKACKILITLEPIQDLELKDILVADINNLKLVLYNNMANCHLQRKNFEHTITLCTKILYKDEDNVKALYRRGVAYGNLRDLEKAAADMHRVLKLQPNNSLAQQHLSSFNEGLRTASKNFNTMVRRMFKA